MMAAAFIACKKNDSSNNEDNANPSGSTYDAGVVIGGIKWATRNVGTPGTFAAAPENVGMYYQWNRRTGWPATGDVTGWNSYGATGDTWEKANDPCPPGWRVPTVDEFKVLATVSIEWRADPFGYVLGGGGNAIFLPVAGLRDYSSGAGGFNGVGYGNSTGGAYWSATPGSVTFSYFLQLYNSIVSVDESLNRAYGLMVRCVAE